MTQTVDPPAADTAPRAPLPLNKVSRPSLWESRELIVNLTRREVSGKYKRTALGRLWSLFNPIATMLIYTLVFAVILRSPPEVGNPSGLNNYALYLMCALLPWTFFAGALSGGMSVLIGNANLVKKVYFRRDSLVISTVASLVVTFGFEIAVLVVGLLAFGAMPLPWLPLVALAMLVLALFALGFAMLLAVANVYFRDTEHFVGIALSLWFYLTPILYSFSLVAGHLQHRVLGVKLTTVYGWNPMTRFSDVFRALLYDNRFPAFGDVAFCLVATLVSLAVGALVFRRFETRLAEEL